jgi:hypothetical protein
LHDCGEGHSDFVHDEKKYTFGFKDGCFGFSETQADIKLLERGAPLQIVGSPEQVSLWVFLANDYIHPTPKGGRCGIRVYLPEEKRDAPGVICSELPNNEGSSVTYSALQIAAEVIRYHKLGEPAVWIEHFLKEATDGASETFDLGERRLTIGEPPGKHLSGREWSRWLGSRCRH